MNFALGLLVYLISFFILLWVWSRHGIRFFSALALTVLLSGIILLLVIPPSEIEHQIEWFFSAKPHRKADDWIVLIYLIIMVVSLLIISSYIAWKALDDNTFVSLK
jgi:hypothetical protein